MFPSVGRTAVPREAEPVAFLPVLYRLRALDSRSWVRMPGKRWMCDDQFPSVNQPSPGAQTRLYFRMGVFLDGGRSESAAVWTALRVKLSKRLGGWFSGRSRPFPLRLSLGVGTTSLPSPPRCTGLTPLAPGSQLSTLRGSTRHRASGSASCQAR